MTFLKLFLVYSKIYVKAFLRYLLVNDSISLLIWGLKTFFRFGRDLLLKGEASEFTINTQNWSYVIQEQLTCFNESIQCLQVSV